MRPVAVDLFAGAGGLSLGFEQAGFDVKVAVELDPIHCAVHEFNFPDCKVICGSVAAMPAERIAALLDERPPDVVFGGPPCQGFSTIGQRMLDDPRNSLVFHFVRMVRDLKARYFVMENVPGLAMGDHRKLLEELVAEFQSIGYDVLLPWKILNATHFGVPQSRRRLFLIGWRRGERPAAYPEPTHDTHGGKFGALPPCPDVADAIGDLPDADEFNELLESDEVAPEERIFTWPSPYAAVLRGMEPDPGDLSYPRRYDPKILTSSMRTVHSEDVKQRFIETPNGGTVPKCRHHKLRPHGFANTLRAGTGRDKGSRTSPRPIHPHQPRVITVREGARLHSYPDWFRFHATKWHGFREVGNSVPPLLGRAVGRSIVEALGVVPEKPKVEMPLGDRSLLYLKPEAAAARYRWMEQWEGMKAGLSEAA